MFGQQFYTESQNLAEKQITKNIEYILKSIKIEVPGVPKALTHLFLINKKFYDVIKLHFGPIFDINM